MKSADYFQQLGEEITKLDHKSIDRLVQIIWVAYLRGRTIWFCGNGGSASTATHWAADVGKNVGIKIKTMALTDNTAWITAIANDISYEDIFVEQLKNFGQPGDVLIAISGSGNSANVVKAVDWANRAKLITVGVLGFAGGKLRRKVKLAVVVGVNHYGYVEGIHSEIHHFVVEALKVKKKLQ